MKSFRSTKLIAALLLESLRTLQAAEFPKEKLNVVLIGLDDLPPELASDGAKHIAKLSDEFKGVFKPTASRPKLKDPTPVTGD